ncbi:MAG: hypothetical protein AB1505_36665 [Candidatus Latescibacterota bacterium]
MSVKRYRDLAQMQRDLWTRDHGDPARLLTQVLAFWRRAVPRCRPRGVTRFRTIEEANRAREEWLAAQVLPGQRDPLS